MNRNSPIPLWAVLTTGVVLVGGAYVFAQRTVAPPQASVIVYGRSTSLGTAASSSPSAKPILKSYPSATSISSATPEAVSKVGDNYTDSVYHFQFEYPSDLTLSQPKTSNYGVKTLLLSNAKGNRFIWLYVTTSDSIEKWNDDYVYSNDCTNSGCRGFLYLDCEMNSSVCEESSFQGMYNFVELQRRGVIKKESERVELDTSVNVASQEVPSSTSISDLVSSGMLSGADKDFLNSFDAIFTSLKFVQ